MVLPNRRVQLHWGLCCWHGNVGLDIAWQSRCLSGISSEFLPVESLLWGDFLSTCLCWWAFLCCPVIFFSVSYCSVILCHCILRFYLCGLEELLVVLIKTAQLFTWIVAAYDEYTGFVISCSDCLHADAVVGLIWFRYNIFLMLEGGFTFCGILTVVSVQTERKCLWNLNEEWLAK